MRRYGAIIAATGLIGALALIPSATAASQASPTVTLSSNPSDWQLFQWGSGALAIWSTGHAGGNETLDSAELAPNGQWMTSQTLVSETTSGTTDIAYFSAAAQNGKAVIDFVDAGHLMYMTRTGSGAWSQPAVAAAQTQDGTRSYSGSCPGTDLGAWMDSRGNAYIGCLGYAVVEINEDGSLTLAPNGIDDLYTSRDGAVLGLTGAYYSSTPLLASWRLPSGAWTAPTAVGGGLRNPDYSFEVAVENGLAAIVGPGSGGLRLAVGTVGGPWASHVLPRTNGVLLQLSLSVPQPVVTTNGAGEVSSAWPCMGQKDRYGERLIFACGTTWSASRGFQDHKIARNALSARGNGYLRFELRSDGRGSAVFCAAASGTPANTTGPATYTAAVSASGGWTRASRIASPDTPDFPCYVASDGTGNVWIATNTGRPTEIASCVHDSKPARCSAHPIVVSQWHDGRLVTRSHEIDPGHIVRRHLEALPGLYVDPTGRVFLSNMGGGLHIYQAGRWHPAKTGVAWIQAGASLGNGSSVICGPRIGLQQQGLKCQVVP